MKVNLEINNTTRSPVTDEFLIAVAEATFAELKQDFFDGKELIISLALVPPGEIKKLNREYRQHDEATDVLAFPEYGNLAEIRESVDKELFLGEVILCYDDIKEYAARKKLDIREECARVVAHGILHLLGYRHGKKMFALQDGVLVQKKIRK